MNTPLLSSMRPPRIRVDSLQRCLCPRLLRASPASNLFLKSFFSQGSKLPHQPQRAQLRRHSSTNAAVAASSPIPEEPLPDEDTLPLGLFPDQVSPPEPESLPDEASPASPTPASPTPASPRPAAPSPQPPPPGLSPLEHIQRLALAKKPKIFAIAAEYTRAGVLSPSLRLYEILLDVCAAAPGDKLHATAWLLFREMKLLGLQPNSRIYHALLRLLAKSPDYIRRAQVLAEMQARWYALTDEGWGWVVQGYIKDRQMEMALDMVMERERRGLEVGRRVYLELVTKLIEVGEVEVAVEILGRVEGTMGAEFWEGIMGAEMRARLWFDLLRKAACDMHYHTTKAAWTKALSRSDSIKPPLFIPPSGVADHVLLCAARHGDFQLAEEVLSLYGAEDIKPQEHHYALLIEAYALHSPPQTRKIFDTLAAMRAARVLPQKNTARAALQVLGQSRALADDAAALLKRSRENDLAAVELVLGAYCRLGELDEAFQLYTQLHELTPQRPDTGTFNVLLRGCAEAGGEKELALYTVAEMRAMKVAPDQASYEYLVRVCCSMVTGEQGKQHLWDAFLFLEEAAADNRVGTLKRMVYEQLTEACRRVGDKEREELVVREMGRVGYGVKSIIRGGNIWGRNVGWKMREGGM